MTSRDRLSHRSANVNPLFHNSTFDINPKETHERSFWLALRNGVEAFAFPLKYSGRKKYFLGTLPISDVFITWAQDPFNIEHN